MGAGNGSWEWELGYRVWDMGYGIREMGMGYRVWDQGDGIMGDGWMFVTVRMVPETLKRML